MDFQINIQTDFELQTEQFLHGLLERRYLQTTVNGYRSYLNSGHKDVTKIRKWTSYFDRNMVIKDNVRV